MKMHLLPLSLLTIILVACDRPKPAPTSGTESQTLATVKEGVRTEQEHSVICGHNLPSVGHCDDYIEVDGQYIPLVGVELDRKEFPKKEYRDGMHFCGHGKMKAKASGEVKDGKFIVSSFILFKPTAK